MAITTTGCSSTTACAEGTPVQFNLQGTGTMYEGPYRLSPCDSVTWDFGDGTTEKLPDGTAAQTHTWAVAGNYTVTAIVKNVFGTRPVSSSFVVASKPSTIVWTQVPPVLETAGSLSIPFRRTGNTERRVSAVLAIKPDLTWLEPSLRQASIAIVFEPGETEQVITLPLYDNHLYDGTRSLESTMHLVQPAGGTFLQRSTVTILDNEPRPTLTCDAISVVEGHDGLRRAAIPCRLSAPLATSLNLYGTLWRISGDSPAPAADGTQIAAGLLSGMITFNVFGDRLPERSEQYRLSIGPYGNEWSPIEGPPATITVLNDDAGLTTTRSRVDLGERIELTLFPGTQYETPTKFSVLSSNVSAVKVPETVVVEPRTDAVTFFADAVGEGDADISSWTDAGRVTTHLRVNQPAAIIVSAHAMTIANGATATLRISLSPARSTPLLVRLVSDPRIVSVPAEAIIPPGGEVAIDVRAVGVGGTAIGVTTHAEAVAGSSVLVDVVPASRKRRSAR